MPRMPRLRISLALAGGDEAGTLPTLTEDLPDAAGLAFAMEGFQGAHRLKVPLHATGASRRRSCAGSSRRRPVEADEGRGQSRMSRTTGTSTRGGHDTQVPLG